MAKRYLKSRKEAEEKIAATLDSLTLMKDYFFTAFMTHNPQCMRVTLKAFTGKDNIEVKSVTMQRVVSNGLEGRGVRFDSRVETEDGTVYNLEVENRPDKALALRLRYYSAMLNADNLAKGTKFSELPPIANIMIMPKDVRGQGKAKYVVRRVFVESEEKIGDNPEFFEDNEVIILVNALYKDEESLIGKVIHDFTTPNSEQKLIPEFSAAVKKFLQKEKERRKMSETITDYGLQGNVLGELVSDAELEQVSKKAKIEGVREGTLQERQKNVQMIFQTGKFSRTELTNLFPDQKTFIQTLKA